MMSNVRFTSVDSQTSSTEEPSLTGSALLFFGHSVGHAPSFYNDLPFYMEHSSSGLTGHCECMVISCTMMKCTPLCMQLGILGKAVFVTTLYTPNNQALVSFIASYSSTHICSLYLLCILHNYSATTIITFLLVHYKSQLINGILVLGW